MTKISQIGSVTNKKQTKLVDPLNGNLFKSILAFAIPVMLTSLLQLAFNAADMIVVGRARGSDPVGQVGATSSLINLIVNFFIGLSVGVSVNVSREYGAGNKEGVGKYVHTAISTAIAAGFLCSAVGIVGSEYLLSLMGTPETHIDGATLYMRIYFIAMPASMVYNFGAAILRSLGNSKTPLIILTSAGIINVIFNLLFVFVFGLAVEGVAIATVISQYVAMVWLIIYLTRVDGPHKLYLKKIGFNPKCMRSIIAIGLPAGISSTLFSLSNVVVQSSVNSFGGTVVNGNTASSNIEGFIYVTSSAFHQAAITFIGQNRGAGKYDRILKSLGVCLIFSLSFEITLGILAYLLREPLLGIYLSDSPETIAVGARRLAIMSLTHFLCGIMDVINGSLRGLGASLSPTLISLVTVCGMRILWISTVFQIHKTIEMIYVVYPISWGLCIICLAILFFVRYRSMLKKHVAEPISADQG